jgi:hypothetical protein
MAMNDQELRQIIDAEVSEASAFSGSTLAAEREQNLNYYYGRPMGNEVDGRSQVVSWDVFEVIESTIPSLLEPFFAGDDIGEFEPVSPEDDEYAEQATDYINHIIKKKNDGFITFNTWIKDGLLSKVGIVRAWWDATEKTRKQSYKGLTEQQLPKFTDDPKVTITAATPYPDPEDEAHRAQAQEQLATLPPEQAMQVQQMLAEPVKQLYDIDIVVNNGPRGARIDNVPPELFVFSRHAKKMADSPMFGEFRQYTRSDLVEMGYSKKLVADLSEYDMPHSLYEQSLRDESGQSIMAGDNRDDAMEKLWLFFGFIRADVDGDGIAEWRRVLMGGNTILENEEVDDHEYCLWSPILIPHRIVGMSYAEPMIEIQNIKTMLTRQYIDSLYIANNPASYALPGANLDDLLSNRIGRVVRMQHAGDAGPLQTTLVANESLQGIELADTMREGRLGVTRYSQGIDADSLHKTAAGANQFLSQAQQRTKMTLRVFAETGCKDLFKRLLRLTCTYQDKAATIKMRNKWVEYDPRNWSDEMDVNIAVGLGTSDKQADVAFLNMMAPYFMQAQPLGIVSKENVYNLGKLLFKKGGIQGGDKLITDPATVPEQAPAKSPEQTLAEAELQIEQMRQQGKMAEAQQKAKDNADKLAADTALKGMDLQLKDKEIRIKEIDLGMKGMELQHRMDQDQAQQGRDDQMRAEKESAGSADTDHKEQMMHMIAGLHEKLDSQAKMETHIVRGPDGKASHSVKRHPAPEQPNEQEEF